MNENIMTKKERDAQEREYAATSTLLDQQAEQQAEQQLEDEAVYAAWDRRTLGGMFQDAYE